MRYDNLNQILYDYFPVLRSQISEQLDTIECYQPGPHVLYESVLNPYVKSLLSEQTDSEALKAVFSFYEMMAQSQDENVRNLLQISLLEALWEDSAIHAAACSYMHPKTKELDRCIGTYLSL